MEVCSEPLKRSDGVRAEFEMPTVPQWMLGVARASISALHRTCRYVILSISPSYAMARRSSARRHRQLKKVKKAQKNAIKRIRVLGFAMLLEAEDVEDELVGLTVLLIA